VFPEQGNLLLRAEVATLPGHGCSSARVLPLTLAKANSCFDWGNTDEDAYRCPKCRIYFCFKCRARVGKQEEQYQCADQSCSCYGKLLCSACTVMVAQQGPVTRPTFNIDGIVAFGTGVVIGAFACVVAYVGFISSGLGAGAAL